jgi:hypothetical protein
MSAMEPFSSLLGNIPSQLSKEENMLLEAVFFTRICRELKDVFKEESKEYFRLMKFNKIKENRMIERNLVRCMIKDIISTEAYSTSGIAYYTHTPIEVINDVASGTNISPSLTVARKVMELHQNVRPQLYKMILKKVIREYAEQD